MLLLEPVIQLGAPPVGFGTDGPGTINFTVHCKDIWPNRAAAEASISPLLKEWDPRVKDRMIQHSFRALPTALHPELPPDANPEDPPVTLRTTKYQDSLTKLRENFEAHQPDGRIVINRQTHADMDPLAAFLPLYRPGPRTTFYRIPSLRPSALWIFRDRTYLNLDEMRQAMKLTGTGIGGSGGTIEGRVKEVLIQGHSHLFPFSAMKRTADVC